MAMAVAGRRLRIRRLSLGLLNDGLPPFSNYLDHNGSEYNEDACLSLPASSISTFGGNRLNPTLFSNSNISSVRSLAGNSWRASSFFFEVSYRGFAKAKKSRVEDSIEALSAETVSTGQAREIASSQMEAAVDVLMVEMSKLRTGRVSQGMLDHVMVEVHGAKMSLTHVAAVSVLDSQTIRVLPFELSMLKDVERAICSSPLRLNPVPEGQTLKVPIPRLTKEHCQTLCKLVSKAGESAKLSIRRGRQSAMDELKKLAKIISKDELKRYEKEIEELTKKHSKSVEDICKKKEQDILTA